MKILPLLASLFVISGCATTYQVPIEEAPPEWRENGDPLGLAVVQGTTETFSGEMKKGDILLKFEVENERVATIENELVWTGRYGGEQKITAGSPAYARQFTLQRTRTVNYVPIGPGTNMNAHNNPIEWCVPRASDAVCIFWEGPNTARYISTSIGTPQNSSPSSPNGMPGPMPIVVEKDAVEFSNAMQVRAMISRLNEREARIAMRIYDGDDWSPFGRSVRRVKWENGHEQTVNLLGAKYKITANVKGDDDVESVQIELLSAPEDIKLITMQEAIDVLNALIAIERAKAAQTDNDDAPSDSSEPSEPSGETEESTESPDGL